MIHGTPHGVAVSFALVRLLQASVGKRITVTPNFFSTKTATMKESKNIVLYTFLVRVITGALLVAAVDDRSHDFYVQMRISCFVGFAALFFMTESQYKWVYIPLTILFNPFFEFHLPKNIWHIIDWSITVVLGITMIYDNERHKKKQIIN